MKWQVVELGDVAVVDRRTVAPDEILPGTKYVGLEHIRSGGGFITVPVVSVGDIASAKFKFTHEHVLFGKLRPYLAKIEAPSFEGVCSTDILPVLPGASLDKRYLLHYLRQPAIVDLATTRSSGANLPRLNPKELEKFLIPLPPLPEQRRIAAILDHADALRVKRRETISRLRELVQSAFVDCFGNPEPGWKVRPLADVVDPSTIVTYGIVQAGDEFQAGVPYIRTGDIVDGEIQTNKLRHTDPAIASKFSRSAVDAGDIVMSIRATVGTTAMVPPCLQGANLTQGTARIAPGRSVEGLYLLEYLRTSSTQQWIQRQVKGATFREITLSKLRELPVLVPDKATQRRFVDFASQVAATQTGAGSSNAELDSLFSSLQSRAFRGEL